MIVSRSKPIEEIIDRLQGIDSVFIVGCGACATVCESGGEAEVADMKQVLEKAGKTITGTMVVDEVCQELLTKKDLRAHKSEVEQSEAFLVMSCGSGVQSVSEATDKRVFSANDTLFLANTQRYLNFAEKCSMCGLCVLDEYAAICPVTRCAKGLLNGPCGGTNEGKCEVDPETDCAWTLIYKRMEAQNRLDQMKKIAKPKDWNVTVKPSRLVKERRKADG